MNKEKARLNKKERAEFVRLKKIHNSTNEAVLSLQETVLEQGREIVVLKGQLNGAEQNVRQQEAIVRSHLTQAAEKETQLVAEIRRLRDTIKSLKEENQLLADLVARARQAEVAQYEYQEDGRQVVEGGETELPEYEVEQKG